VEEAAEEEAEVEEAEEEAEEEEPEMEEAEEEEAAEELYEIIINGKTYYYDNKESGNIYEVNDDGEITMEVGYLKMERHHFIKAHRPEVLAS